MGRTKKLKAQITIDCVCLWLRATVSLASVHNSHNDRRSQWLVKRLPHLCFIEERGGANIEFIGISKGKSIPFKIIHCMMYSLFCHQGFHTKSSIAYCEINTAAKQ